VSLANGRAGAGQTLGETEMPETKSRVAAELHTAEAWKYCKDIPTPHTYVHRENCCTIF
jgi:hypothetical protein